MITSINKYIRPSILILLTIALILATKGHLDRAITRVGLGSINASNDKYLSDSFDKSLKGFLVLSGIKSGVAVLEGSTVGVGFNLEVGDIVQSIYDYVDVAWRTSLAGCTVLLLMRLTLETVQKIDHWLLTISLSLLLVYFITQWFFPRKASFLRFLKDGILYVASLTVAVYVILPLSIAGASYLSAKITQPLVDEAQAGFESLESDLTAEALNNRFFPADNEEEKSLWSRLDFKAKLENSKQAIVKMGQWLKQITKDFAIWSIKLIAGYLFDCIVFPLAFFVVAYVFTRGILTYLLGITRSRSMREDFDGLIHKLYDKKEK